MNTSCLIELHYLPCLAWFSAVRRYSTIVLEKHEQFRKQSYRNRCYLLGANRVEKLVIPVSARHNHTLVTDLQIDYSQKWVTNHWRTIESAYRKAPYFEHYAPSLHAILFSRQAFLYDLNYNLLTLSLKWLNLSVRLTESTSYHKQAAEGTTDLRNQFSPKRPIHETYYTPVPYTQVFGNSFVKNLSIIDLIFCSGPEAQKYIGTETAWP